MGIFIENRFQRADDTDFEPAFCHVRGTLLFELSSVTVHRDKGINLDDGVSDFIISGYIKLIDDDNKEVYLYNRNSDDPEKLFMVDRNLAILQKSTHDRPQLVPKSFLLKLYLNDESREKVIVDDEVQLNFIGNEVYDKEEEIWFNKGNGLVTVRYTLFQSAVVARVEFMVLKKEDRGTKRGRSGEPCDVSGSDYLLDGNGTVIEGHSLCDDVTSGTEYENGCKVSVGGCIYGKSKLMDGKTVSRMLFGNVYEDEKWAVNTATKLSFLAVPAYSSLIFSGDLKVDGEQIYVDLEFVPSCRYYGHGIKEVIMGQKWRVQVEVIWKHAFEFLKNNVFREFVTDMREPEESSGEENFEFLDGGEHSTEEGRSFLAESEDVFDREKSRHEELQLHLHPESPSDGCDEIERLEHIERVPSPSFYDYGKDLVEVFSVSIHCYGDSSYTFRLHGDIVLFDLMGNRKIYERDEGQSELLRPNDTVSLVQPLRAYRGPYFEMFLDLKDDEGREISNGYLGGYGIYFVDPWLDRRICSVVRGKDGFAVVHYTIVHLAMECGLKVILSSDNGCQVHGSICGWHSNHIYNTAYEKKYYRIDFLAKGESESLELAAGDVELPLSKPSVAVPRGASLVVEADLSVRVPGEDVYVVETLKDTLTFEPAARWFQTKPQTIQGRNCQLTVSVTWS